MLMSEFTVSELREHLDAMESGGFFPLQPRLRILKGEAVHPDMVAVLAEIEFSRWPGHLQAPVQFTCAMLQSWLRPREHDVERPVQDLMTADELGVCKWLPYGPASFASIIDLDRELSVYANSGPIVEYDGEQCFREVPEWNVLEETPLSAFGGAYVLK
jgi:hypothetical protein